MLGVPADVVGTVSDQNLDEYRLELAPLGSEAFRLLAQGTTPVAGAVLARLDPDRLANGAYLLRLSARDMGGRSREVLRAIEVSSAAKVGAYTRAEKTWP